MTAVAVLVGNIRRPRRIPRRPIQFSRMIKRIADRHGVAAATAWTESVLRYQRGINMNALRSAIASKNLQNIEAVVGASRLQQTIGRTLRQPFTTAAQTAGMQSVAILKGHGLAASFNAVHPNVVNFARAQAAELVVGVAAETKAVIAEVIALGAQHGLDVAQQARAIREVVGLPPNWASAPQNLAQEIRTGQAAAATSRRLSAAAKQQIRSRIANGTVTQAFIDEMTETYAQSLINRRALNIARTETLRAAHHGLNESWGQAQRQGVLPQAARRFWIVTPDDRLSVEHARIPGMNPNGRRLDEPFVTPDSPGHHMFPPSRPNCRCSVGLLPNVPDDFDVTEGVEAPLRSIAPEPELSPVLSAAEQSAALERLGGLRAGLEGGQKVVSTLDVGFAGRIDFIAGTTKAGRLSTPVVVDPHQIFASQDNVVIKGVQRYIRRPPSELPLVVRLEDGRMLALEGHTRLSAQMLAGRGQVPVRLVGMEGGKLVRIPTPPRALRAVGPFTEASVAVEAEAQALYESTYGFIPRNRPMWSQLQPGDRARARFLARAEENLRAGTPGVRPPRTGRRSARPTFGEQPTPSAPPPSEIPPPRVVKGEAPSAEMHEDVIRMLRAANVDPSVARYTELKQFHLGGRLRQTAAEYRPSDGRLYFDVRHLRSRADRGLIIPHEAQHLKFDVAIKTDPKIRKFIERNFETLRREDGVTAYSKEHWLAHERYLQRLGFTPVEPIVTTIPVNETLSEIVASRAAAVGEAFYGSPTYRKLLKMVDDAYQKAIATGRAARVGGRTVRSVLPEGPKPPLRDLSRGEPGFAGGPSAERAAGVRSGLTNHLDTVFDDVAVARGEELAAIDNYMSFHYSTLNNGLRSGNLERFARAAYGGDEALIAERLADVRGMDKIMARMPELGEPATVWRSVRDVRWIAQGQTERAVLANPSQLVGTEFADGGFVSTTTLRNAASGWSKLAKNGGTLIEIRLPPNTRGMWAKRVARDAQESAIVKREYLLPRGARFKVIDARTEGDILHLVVEYLP